MRPISVTVGPLATASANNICLTQTPTASAGFTINGALASGGVATLDTPRRVLFTPTGNESANTFMIVGTNASNMPQTEVIAGTNATAFYTNLDFKTVTSISLATTAAATITVGTNNVASSAWVRLDDYALSQTAIQATVSGTVTYTIQQTLQDPSSPTNPVNPYSVVWLNTNDTAAVNATTTVQTSYQYSPAFAKVTITAGTGSVNAIFTQFGVVPL
jgi:hypothetical protein